MAKQKQSISLDQITQKLGYTLDYYNHTVVEETTFYSDFTPVPKNSYHIALRELEDFNKKYQLQAKDVSQGMPDIYNDDDDDGGDDDAKVSRSTALLSGFQLLPLKITLTCVLDYCST